MYRLSPLLPGIRPCTRRHTFPSILAIGLILLSASAKAELPSIDIGSATEFAVLAGSKISNSVLGTITGDLSPPAGALTLALSAVTGSTAEHGGYASIVGVRSDIAQAYTNDPDHTSTVLHDDVAVGEFNNSGIYQRGAIPLQRANSLPEPATAIVSGDADKVQPSPLSGTAGSTRDITGPSTALDTGTMVMLGTGLSVMLSFRPRRVAFNRSY